MHPGHLGFIWLEQKSKCVTKDELWLFHSSSYHSSQGACDTSPFVQALLGSQPLRQLNEVL